MKKRLLYSFILVAALSSCLKEYSTEESGDTSGTIIGADCRIDKIAFNDSASGVSLGSIAATISPTDLVNDITQFDSLTLTLDYTFAPQYFGDTVTIDADQYFIRDNTKRIQQLHGLVDPTVTGSPEFDVAYNYDAAGFLINKTYTYSLLPGIPFQSVNYTYTGGNLTYMETVDEFTSDVIKNADLTYYNNIAPKNYLNIFPDEDTYAPFNQFFDFGKKSVNAVKSLKVRFFDPGNILVDSAVSTFSSYIMSRDNYVTSVYMLGDDQASIPAAEGKLKFTYKCK
jgi:hypothetical protein